MRLTYGDFGSYVKTFHTGNNVVTQGPKLLQVSYKYQDHGGDEWGPKRLLLQPFLKFRADHPLTTIEFKPLKISGYEHPERAKPYRTRKVCGCGKTDSGDTRVGHLGFRPWLLKVNFSIHACHRCSSNERSSLSLRKQQGFSAFSQKQGYEDSKATSTLTASRSCKQRMQCYGDCAMQRTLVLTLQGLKACTQFPIQ